MCGIAFWSRAETGSAITDVPALVAALLGQIESRGRDSAGVAWHDTDGTVRYDKEAIRGSLYAAKVGSFIPVDSAQGIIHTRWATQGSPSRNGNNHPIVRPGIVLVHNGHVRNDDDVFKTLAVKRYHEVDSEAIAASLAGPGSIDDRLGRLKGNVAVAWMRVTHGEGEGQNPPMIQAARCSSSPLCIGQTAAGDVIAASTQQLLLAACRKVGIELAYVQEVREWTYLRIVRGKIVTYRALVEPAWSRLPAWPSRPATSYDFPRRHLYGAPAPKVTNLPKRERKQHRKGLIQATRDATSPEVRTAERIAEHYRQEHLRMYDDRGIYDDLSDAIIDGTDEWTQADEDAWWARQNDTLGRPVDDLDDPFDDDADEAYRAAMERAVERGEIDEEDLQQILQWRHDHDGSGR